MPSLLAQATRLILRGGGVPVQPLMFHMRAPYRELVPYFRFEWHVKKQIVYVIDIVKGELTKRPVGNAIAYSVDTEGGAWNVVLIWCRGYMAAKEGRSHNDSGKIVLLGEDNG